MLRICGYIFLILLLMNAVFVKAGIELTEEMKELIDMLHGQCTAESGASEDLIVKAQKGEFVDDDKVKCYMKCIMTEMACIDEDGTVDVEAVISVLPPDVQPHLEPAVRKCGTQAGANACDNAFLTYKCYYEQGEKDYFFLP